MRTVKIVTTLLLAGGVGYFSWPILKPHLKLDQQALEGSTKESNMTSREEVATDSIKSPSPDGSNAALDQGNKALGLAPLDETFSVLTNFTPINIRDYQRTYPNVYQGWMPKAADQAQQAKDWTNHLGPLGVRVRSHVPQHQSRPAFSAIVPHCLRTLDGKLGLTAAEVISIAPGSPAENHLQVGDFILAIEDQWLQSGNAYRPEWKFTHKDRRDLQLMLGEKIDEAQARGDIRLKVMRYPQQRDEVFSEHIKSSGEPFGTSKIPVSVGDKVHLIVEPNGRNNYDHLAWLRPQLIGNRRTLELSDETQIKPFASSTGWGKVTYGKDLKGKKLPQPGISVHAASTLTFEVPEGYHSFQTNLMATESRGDLIAKVIIERKREALPVHPKNIWEGKSGNKNLATQTFDLPISGNGQLTLESHDSDGRIHGDGTIWLDLVLEGEYGTQRLFDLPWKHAHAGYGRASYTKGSSHTHQGKEYQKGLHLHASGKATWVLPKGTKRVTGSFSGASYGKVQPRIYFTKDTLPLHGIHKEKLVDLRFPIGKTGSFQDNYPANCAKSTQMATRHTAWLAAQQREDGTWPRLAGYTTHGWDTAWCALALMSSGDSQYDAQVKKAAYHLAYDQTPSEWLAERAMRLMFLSEYYLRTKDDKILAGVQAAYHQVEACCKTDYMAGHKVNGFGYGIAGQHYGTGHMALAMALASKTPAVVDRELVSNVIRHAGEVCVNGSYAYGRGRRLARSDARNASGGNAMLGPGMLGAIIAGGHDSSIKEALERWEQTIGDGDNSHATSSLAFIFSSLAMHAGDETIFRKHMQNFRYKMTIDDNWEGGILKSAFPMDYQSGEGVTSSWIRTAGTILVLNAPLKQLAITGKQEHLAEERLSDSAVSEWGGQVHAYYLRNWCIAKELLGSKAPPTLSEGIKKLHTLPRTMELVPRTQEIVTEMAPSLIEAIAADKRLHERQRAYAIELLCGLDFQIYTELKDDKQSVKLHVKHPLHQLNWLEKKKANMYELSPLELNAKVSITGENFAKAMDFEIRGTEKFNLDEGSRKWSLTRPLKQASTKEYKGKAEISFTVGTTRVSYTRPLTFNKTWAYSQNINLRKMKLKLRVAPRAYYQSQPLMISGIAFDCMFPKERMIDVKTPQEGVAPIHEGDRVIVDLVSENFICGWMHGFELEKMTQVTPIAPKSFHSVTGQVTGDLATLHDFSHSTGCSVKPVNGKTVVEYDFGKAVTLNGLDIALNRRSFIRVWYQQDAQWIPLVWDTYSPETSHNPRFPDATASKWRVELRGNRVNKLHTLRFYHNPNRIAPLPPLLQMQNPSYLPPIQAN